MQNHQLVLAFTFYSVTPLMFAARPSLSQRYSGRKAKTTINAQLKLFSNLLNFLSLSPDAILSFFSRRNSTSPTQLSVSTDLLMRFKRSNWIRKVHSICNRCVWLYPN